MLKKLQNLVQRVRSKKETKDKAPESLTDARVAVDYPQSGEAVTSPEYTIRITSDKATTVQVFIDGGPWLPCRLETERWWYDWAGYLAGKHQVKARAHMDDGEIVTSRLVDFVVESAQKKH
jgi:hypothetical protein